MFGGSTTVPGRFFLGESVGRKSDNSESRAMSLQERDGRAAHVHDVCAHEPGGLLLFTRSVTRVHWKLTTAVAVRPEEQGSRVNARARARTYDDDSVSRVLRNSSASSTASSTA